ncbi:MAG: hypothetical protein F7B59_08305 [Desulfurococcales archaeon]|nr:hypothetical protein [Desulfurococcales archaeon]
MYKSNALKKRRLMSTLNEVKILVYSEKKISLAKAALELGYTSVEYFKRAILPFILEFQPCIDYDQITQSLVWKCGKDVEEVVMDG